MKISSKASYEVAQEVWTMDHESFGIIVQYEAHSGHIVLGIYYIIHILGIIVQ